RLVSIAVADPSHVAGHAVPSVASVTDLTAVTDVTDVTASTDTSVAAPEATRRGRRTGATLLAYFHLTKPRVIELLLVTTVPAMILAAGELPSLWLILCVLVGGALSAGGANTIN